LVLFEIGNFILIYRLAKRLFQAPAMVSRILWLYAGLFPPIYAMLGFVLLITYRLPDKYLLVLGILLVVDLPAIGTQATERVVEASIAEPDRGHRFGPGHPDRQHFEQPVPLGRRLGLTRGRGRVR